MFPCGGLEEATEGELPDYEGNATSSVPNQPPIAYEKSTTSPGRYQKAAGMDDSLGGDVLWAAGSLSFSPSHELQAGKMRPTITITKYVLTRKKAMPRSQRSGTLQ